MPKCTIRDKLRGEIFATRFGCTGEGCCDWAALVLVVLAAVPLVLRGAGAPDEQTLLIVNTQIIDGTGAPVQEVPHSIR